MNEKTEAPTKRLRVAASSVGLPASVEQPGVPAKRVRRRKQSALRIEDLRDADLKGKDLTKVKGLLPEHLAGADLTGAELPDEIAKFPALDQVAAISSEARKIFIGLLAACVYSWLVIGTTTDVALLVNTASSPLPAARRHAPPAGRTRSAGRRGGRSSAGLPAPTPSSSFGAPTSPRGAVQI